MRQESLKKSKLWIWLTVAIVAVAAIVGVVLAILLTPGQQQEQPQQPTADSRLYWNIDGKAMTAEDEMGLTSREPGEDGLYHVRFALDGEQVELTVAGDRQLINYIDSLDVMGLVFDADGMVVDAVNAKTVATEIASDFFVREAGDNTIYVNSSITMNGMEIPVVLTDATGVYDVDPDAKVVGAVSTANVMDKVKVYGDAQGNVTHVFIVERAAEAGVYWRLDQKLSNGETTREKDENGAYTIPFAYKGERVELKCKDKKLVNEIDAANSLWCAFALVLDDEGYIVDNVTVSLALKGKYVCKNYDVTAVDGKSFSTFNNMEGNKRGEEYKGVLADDCEIYLVETDCHAVEQVGQKIDSLQVGDRVEVYTNMEGEAILIYVVRRMVDSPMYYISTRYSVVDGITTRPKDANGYWVFDFACQGKPVSLKTKDAEIAKLVEWKATGAMGLKVEGSIIKDVYSPNCICGWTSTLTDCYVTQISGIVYTFTDVATGTSYNRMLVSGGEVYDVTGNFGVKFGAKTTLQVGDKVQAFRNIGNELTHVYVRQRYEESADLYFNLNRKYNSTDKVTNRVPDEDGYYVFEMATLGKQVTLKTKNKELASFIDSQTTNMVALKVSGGIIKNAYIHLTALEYGIRPVNYNYVKNIDGKTFTTYYYSGDEKKDSTVVRELADNYKVYNMSTGYESFQGEKTTLKKDDQIQTFASQTDGKINLILVINRKVDSPVYWHYSRKGVSSVTGQTNRVPNGEGYYVFDLIADGKIKQFKTKDVAIATSVESYTTGFALMTKGDIILRACSATNAKGISKSVAGHSDITELKGNKATATRLRTGAENFGKVEELEFAKDCKFINTTTYSEGFGQLTTLKLGDRVACYLNMDGKVAYCFIPYENTRKAGPYGYCEHCEQEVFWDAFTGSVYEADGHYYLTHDTKASKQLSVGSDKADAVQPDVVFDLNGFTYSSTARGALVYSQLSIVDSAGGGKMVKSGSNSNTGGIIMVTGTGKLNIYGGEFTWDENITQAGRMGGVLYVAGEECQLNMYDGYVHGGKVTYQEDNTNAPYGGNVYINHAEFNMYGGTIEGGDSEAYGGNIYVGGTGAFNLYGGTVKGGTATTGSCMYITGSKATDPATLNVMGGTIDGKVVFGSNRALQISGAPRLTELNIPTGMLAKLGDLKPGADITVMANGIFTEATDKADTYKAYFHTGEIGGSVTVEENALCYTAPEPDYTADLEFAEGTTDARCPVCGDMVTWTALSADQAMAAPAVAASHYYLPEDITYTGTTAYITAGGTYNNSGVTAQKTVCLHLNGHDLTATNARVINGSTGIMNVMGKGTVSGNDTSGTNGATLHINCQYGMGVINLYGGNYVKAATNEKGQIFMIGNNGGTVNLYKDATVDGTGCTSANPGLCVEVNGGIRETGKNTGPAAFNVIGGTVKGGAGVAVNIKTQYAAFSMNGGRIEGTVQLLATSGASLAGECVIGQLDVANGVKLQLGEITGEASVKVSANGVFTTVHEKAADMVKYFTAALDDYTVTAKDNALSCDKK